MNLTYECGCKISPYVDVEQGDADPSSGYIEVHGSDVDVHFCEKHYKEAQALIG